MTNEDKSAAKKNKHQKMIVKNNEIKIECQWKK